MTHVPIDVAFFFFIYVKICAFYFTKISLWNEMKYFFMKLPEEKRVSH